MPRAIKRLEPNVQHFFDTNFFVLDASVLPPLKHVPSARRWVTETVRDEVNEKLSESAAKSALYGYRVLRFDDLYAQDPNVCPTFYGYVESIYSPANVGSEDFYEELLLSRRIKGVATHAEKRLYEQLRRRSTGGHAKLPDGTPKPEGLRKLERFDSVTRQKIVAAIRDFHPAVMRDIKNLALMLYYGLFTQQNVAFYTADGDPVSLLLRWVEATSMRAPLLFDVINELGEEGRVRVAQGRRAKLLLPVEEFLKHRQRWNDGMLHDSYKTSGCRFTIRRWDQNAHKFDEDVYLTFEKEIAHVLARSHNNMQCHFTKNNELGNWLHLLYEWPPADPRSHELCVTVRSKSVNRTSITVSAEEHSRECLYRRTDAAGRLHEWSQFSWEHASQ